MKNTYDLYGFVYEDIEKARGQIEKCLDIIMEAHQSEYRGNYYRFKSNLIGSLVLQENVDEFDNEPLEIDFADNKVLLFVEEVAEPQWLEKKLSNLVPPVKLLKREVV